MSKISLASNASGTGIFTLASPATNTNRTLTLPDSTGTLLDTNGGTITGTLTVTGVTTLGNGAVLGVPASGTATNLTGLPISTGVSGLGTGIATALAVNVGTAGAPVVNGGALGSPSSVGTMPAFTLGGTVSGGGNQINNVVIGTTTPLAGAFTTLSATKATAGDVITFTNGGATPKTGFLYSDASFVGLTTGAGITGNGLYFNAATNNSGIVFINNATIGTFSSTGLAVTGTLSARGALAATAISTPTLWLENTTAGKYISIKFSGSVQDGYFGYLDAATSSARMFEWWDTNSSKIMSLTGDGKLTVTDTLAGGTSGTGYSFSGSAPANSLTLNSSGFFGIGTPSPNTLLTLLPSTNTAYSLHFGTNDYALSYGTKIYVQSKNPAGTTSSFSNTTKITSSVNGRADVEQYLSYVAGTAADDYQSWSTAGTSRMLLDGAGNLGLGVTPSAWRTDVGPAKAVQLPGGSVWAYSTSEISLGQNYYYGAGGGRYRLLDGKISNYFQASGEHYWQTSVTGLAGVAATNIDIMTLDSSGNLGIGTTSPDTKLDIDLAAVTPSNSSYHGIVVGPDSGTTSLGQGAGIGFRLRNTNGGGVGGNSIGAAIYGIQADTGANAGTLAFYTRPDASNFTERARIDSSGNLLVGATSTRGGAKLDIRSDTSIALGSNASFFGTIGYDASTGYLSLAAEAAAGSGIKCLSGATTLSIIDPNSLYAYVGVNPSNSGTTNARIFNSSAGAGTVTLYIGNQAITTSSDVRLKENIVDTQRNALEILGQLRVVDHTWNDPSDQCENNRNSRGTWMGLIAQEAQPIIPWLVNKPTADVDENGDPQYWHMDYGYSVPLLVKAIQEQQALITQLTARITALETA